MRLTNKFWLFVAVSIFIVLIMVAVIAIMFWQHLPADQRVSLGTIIKNNFTYFFGIGLLFLAAIVFLLDGILNTYVIPIARITEEASLVYTVNPSHRIAPMGGSDIVALVKAINEGARRYEELKQSVDLAVRRAKQQVEEEKELLAELMSELPVGVVICNHQGHILLYNKQAVRLLVEDGSRAETGNHNGKRHFIGLGRSISDVIDDNLISHALDEILYKLEHGQSPVLSHFVVTSCEEALLRVEAAPILNQQRQFNGFILLLRDITVQLKADSQATSLLQFLSRSLRTSLASIRTAIETIIEFPDMADEQQEHFKKIIHQESVNLSRVLEETADDYSRYVKSHWPLVSVSGHNLAETLRRKAAQKLGLQVDVDSGQMECWIKIDSYAFTLALLFLLRQVQQRIGADRFSLRMSLQDCLTSIDLIWSGDPIEQNQIRQWENEVLTVERDSLPLTLSDVISHHQAEIWSYCDTRKNCSYLRIVLPAGDSCQPETAGGLTILPGSRPEYFDFDLFNQPGQTPDLDSRSLAELSYTVFDTETTGLNPRQGDEIISIGAVRIINGRLLRNEYFDQLVDPQRPLPIESIPVHGIQPEKLKGQPTIETVLPHFHRFARDTILVAHNAAFDMQMLKMKETRTGVKFINPVLDTLLLSAVVHPVHQDHSMEAMARRLGIVIVDRHTALGDALSTAELFLKLIPLLAAQGIVTFKDARLVSQKTYYARLKY